MCLYCGIVETQNLRLYGRREKHIPNTDAIFYVNGRHKNIVFQNQKKMFCVSTADKTEKK